MLTKHTITATAGEHGRISPSGSVKVTEGADKTFTITPDTGYEIDTLTVDGTAVTASSSYTFSDVTDDHTISVTFKACQPSEEKIKPALDISFDYSNFGAIDANSTYRDILKAIEKNLEWKVLPTSVYSKTGISFLINGKAYESYFDDDNNNTVLLDSKVNDDAIVKIEIIVHF